MIRKNIDLNHGLLDTKHDFVPGKSTDPQEISTRQSLPKGNVVLGLQRDALRPAREIALYPYRDPDARTYMFGKLSVALTTSAWYTSTLTAQDVMRRRGDLPQIAEDADHIQSFEHWRETPSGLLQKIGRSFSAAESLAAAIYNNHNKGKPNEALRRRFGRQAFNTAMQLETFNMVPASELQTAEKIQNDVWQLNLGMVERSQHAHESTFGEHPTLAMLADSNLGLWMSDDAPEEAIQAYHSAFAPIEDHS